MAKKTNSRRVIKAFTLLEIVIALVLLMALSSLVGLGVKDLFRRLSFEKSVKQLEYELKQCQLFALLYRSDLEVQLVCHNKKWQLLHTSPEKALKRFSKTALILDGVTAVGWNEKAMVKSVTFFADGSVYPLGVIRLEGENQRAWIDLQKPLQIKRVKVYGTAHPILIPVNKPIKSNGPHKPKV